MSQLTVDEALQLAFQRHCAGQLDEAESIYRQIAAALPDHFDAVHLLGALCYQRNRLEEAREFLERAMRLDPAAAEPYYHFGCVLQAQNRFSEAITYYRLAIARRPEYAEAFNNLGNAHKELGEIGAAIAAMREHVRLRPEIAGAWSNLLLTLWYDPRLSVNEIVAEHRRWGERVAGADSAGVGNERSAERRLRVGYVSPDFRQHPVTTFFEPVLAGHDRAQFEVFCYSHPLRVDDATTRLKTLADQWRDITHLTDEQAAQQIRADGIDILVDLAGHTAGNRLGVFALRAAPVLVSYLGYIGTTGLPAIGHRIADAITDPATTDAFYTEQVIRLETPFACYRPPAGAPEVDGLPAARRGWVTFASFNALGKIPDDLLALWAMILDAVPNSRLVMAAVGLGDAAAQRRIRGFFEARQISAERLELRPFETLSAYLALHKRVDILLDTFPVNGHTVSCHALYMGVPLVTMAGCAYASRLGASLLEPLGLGDLVAATGEEYVRKAVGLAMDGERLSGLRKDVACADGAAVGGVEDSGGAGGGVSADVGELVRVADSVKAGGELTLF